MPQLLSTPLAPPPTNRLDTGLPFVYMAGSGASQRPVIMCLVEKGVQPIACSPSQLGLTRGVLCAQGSSMWSFALLKGLGVPGYPDANGTFSRTGHGFPLPYKVMVHRWNSWSVS